MSKSDSRVKSVPVMIRMTPEDRALLVQKASDAGMTLPSFLIACGMGRRTRSAVDDHIINELRRLGEQQRSLFLAGARDEVLCQAVVVAILAAILHIRGQS